MPTLNLIRSPAYWNRQIGNEYIGAGMERVDRHLAVCGARELDAAVPEISAKPCDALIALSNKPVFGQKIGKLAGIKFALATRSQYQ